MRQKLISELTIKSGTIAAGQIQTVGTATDTIFHGKENVFFCFTVLLYNLVRTLSFTGDDNIKFQNVKIVVEIYQFFNFVKLDVVNKKGQNAETIKNNYF
jgi:hypothetical protein